MKLPLPASGTATAGLVALLFCAAALVPRGANAQGRGPTAIELRERAKVDPVIARARELEDLNAWLRRLAGRFRVTDESSFPMQTSLRDCIAIGTGVGVNCVAGPGPDARGNSTGPSIVMYGVDPDKPGIRFLQVDSNSIAEDGLGTLGTNTVSFRGTCPLPPGASGSIGNRPFTILRCAMHLRIFAPPDSRTILIEHIKSFTLLIRTGNPKRPTEIMTFEIPRRWGLQRMPDGAAGT